MNKKNLAAEKNFLQAIENHKKNNKYFSPSL